MVFHQIVINNVTILRLLLIRSFNATDHFQQIEEGPIRENTIITLEPEKGKILHEWGSGMFYMPHGLTMDRHDNYWVTDVGLHQAFKVKLSIFLKGIKLTNMFLV